MALMVATDKCIITAKELHVDYYNYSDHKTIDVPATSKPNEKDFISDIAVSDDAKHLALITSVSKQLMVYDLLQLELQKAFTVPRSASKIRFTVDGSQILVADKSGDILIYDIKTENAGNKLLGHLSLLLDVLQTHDSKYIISCDRDEKIKVSCYPNTYNIQTYCLGHKEFVNHIELLPHNNRYLTSSSGDGTVKIWDYTEGKLEHTVDTSIDLNDDQLKQNFINMMDEGGIEVATLPIVHFTASSLNKTSSILAVTVHTCNSVLIYSVHNEDNQFSHKLEHTLELERFPSAIKLYNGNLFVYDDSDCYVHIYNISESDATISVKIKCKVKMFESKTIDSESKEAQLEAIKVLYKRKFDNVQEYQERKKQRLEKTSK
ncbi:tRNA (guanine-N(7)-)-methyltransferase non-catalytic subunit wuho [Anticarsia gemmatalis]|uniref:tRNA (guanine-N(7)-)-methyltransferase non-catalytic subunit wuho n=1 Tax=Anticarsia gemmatalis TaxID=129554 RepID=UPI003F768182